MGHVILLTAYTGPALDRIRSALGLDQSFAVVQTLDALLAEPIGPETSLISFGTGVIVPSDTLARLSRPAYNVHAASPDFPGRDPHHHALYRQAPRYGATLHLMEARVDAGPIVGAALFAVTVNARPSDLLAAASEAGLQLIERFGPRLLEPPPLPALPDVHWGPVKTRRSDLKRLSTVSCLMDEAEFERRYRAFDGGAHDNLTLRLHGRTFRIEKREEQPAANGRAFADFTEDGFVALMRALVTRGYRFAELGDGGSDRHVVWRHDVDFSMHRAARLAELEAREGARATYFVNPRCEFYNLLEPGVLALVRSIQDHGHVVGLHFDAGALGATEWKRPMLATAVAKECDLLESILGTAVGTVSWHNPDLSNVLDFDDEVIAGRSNAYSARMRREYVYCSDSNGFWRFKSMTAVIAEGHERLYLLTHPAWWTPEPMSPSERIDRAILGRARAVRRSYDILLARGGRRNVTG